MYKALIVDDEIYAVLGIKSGVNWEALQVSEVYEAYNMRDAIKVFERTNIDIMICDIEMPKGNGIELLEWVNEKSPDTETIFLTAHSNFDFMKRAIQLDGFDYLLKPIEFDVLQSTISKALQSIQHELELNRLREQYQPSYALWSRKKTLIADKFWNDLFTQRIVCTPANAANLLEDHELPLHEQSKILPIMISVETWTREFSVRDEEMMEYAIRKAASEMLLSDQKGEVIQTKQGVNVVVAYMEEDRLVNEQELVRRCEAYIQSCKQYFYCEISCYIGEVTTLYEAQHIYNKLLEMEYNNMHKSNQVYSLQQFHMKPITLKFTEFSAWTILIEQGKLEEMEKEIKRCMTALRSDSRLSAGIVRAFYQDFQQMIHYILHKNGLTSHELFLHTDGVSQEVIPRSIEELQAIALHKVSVICHYLHRNESIIQRVQCFIADHLYDPITREQLASYVHLNPAYLSRLFKREVGDSITDYILHERMKLANELIRNTKLPISDIAKSLGYTNFSYFSKMYKKVYQATPQHVRRQYA
ncbi:DNA-binding response regulator [Paenibacillus selenitireducens]|uniref:DNA-binding response regulator n=1 Tax=Paenibacillus selenitireducens TaxID=1324314 RepID=A0A1T2XMV3_9BACL|nr:response regulator [Paenibacillus selenitireducens]OPA81200.1 DNA-binding response regulator [Paenibacillus selenitireducens]